jgi:hypothetical protein
MAIGQQNPRQFRDLFASAIPFEGAVNFASVADGNEDDAALTVTGAALGDLVLFSFVADNLDMTITGQVTAANTVTFVAANNTGGTIDLAAANIKGVVLEYSPEVGLADA